MIQYDPYEIKKIDDLNYNFVTDNYVIYSAQFQINRDYFPRLDEGCSSCKDILELTLVTDSPSPPKDFRTGATVFKIIEEKLSKSCNGVMYRCYDNDKKGCYRDRLFNSWFDEFGDDDKINLWVNDFSGGEGVIGKMYLMVDKGCINQKQIVDDFVTECEPCREHNSFRDFGSCS